ncbi:MAG: sugar ABC transporter permease [Armatimonadetes bacterium]|nr:sugar ABC transporter permease [Armatimonadota bacterium]MBS1711143.1 sugar ABC transporter permease [Armatimonadota bacterium]MBX3108817.1 sugar ABC transporter permease [Fimbriimonadaceae bacterium]
MKSRRTGWLFVAPALIHLAVFAIGPIAYAVILSFTDWNILKGGPRFAGTGNFARIFDDGQFLRSLMNSFVYTAASVPLGMAVALGVALLVSQRLKGITFFRTVFYLPAVCSQVAIAMVWIYIYLPKKGLVNAILGWMGLPDGTDFLSAPGWAMAALVFMGIWVGLGPRMILYVSGLLNIPESFYEAAQLDGASPWQQFSRVTLPLLSPTTFFVGLTGTIGAMQVFTPIYMMTKGGPEGTTDVVGYHIYSAAWERFQIGEASAMSVILFGVVLLLSLIPMRTVWRQSEGVF